MVAAIRQNVTVQAGGLIELRLPDLKAGARAEVIVLVEDDVGAPRPLVSFIGAGKGSFSSPAEIDTYIRDLRDEWDR